jgi:hypothetical protein
MGCLRIFDGRLSQSIVPCPCICTSRAKLGQWHGEIGDWQHWQLEYSKPQSSGVRGDIYELIQYIGSRIILRRLYLKDVTVSLEDLSYERISCHMSLLIRRVRGHFQLLFRGDTVVIQ